MSRLLVLTALFVVLGLARPAAAQEARLVIREAYVPATMDGAGAEPDTSAMERVPYADAPGGTLHLGRVLLRLGPGTVTAVDVGSDVYTGTSELSIRLAEAVAPMFAALTAAADGKMVALVLDGRVLTAPTVRGKIPDGLVQVTGQFTVSEAVALAAAIREATGAAGVGLPERPPADFSTPEDAVVSYLAAIDAEDWATLAASFHPDALTFLHDDLSETLVISGDSARLVAGDEPSSPPVAVRDVLGAGRSVREPGGLSDQDALTLALALSRGAFVGGVSGDSFGVVGSLPDGPDTAHVVIRLNAGGVGVPGASEASVVTVRRSDGEWRVLLQFM